MLAYKFTRPEGQGTFPELWVVELAGEVTESPHKLVAPAGRLVRRDVVQDMTSAGWVAERAPGPLARRRLALH